MNAITQPSAMVTGGWGTPLIPTGGNADVGPTSLGSMGQSKRKYVEHRLVLREAAVAVQ